MNHRLRISIVVLGSLLSTSLAAPVGDCNAATVLYMRDDTDTDYFYLCVGGGYHTFCCGEGSCVPKNFVAGSSTSPCSEQGTICSTKSSKCSNVTTTLAPGVSTTPTTTIATTTTAVLPTPGGTIDLSTTTTHSADFESGLGSWYQDPTDTFEWTSITGSTPSVGTGPTGDHTSGTGKYMYIETTAPRVKGDTALLYSPLYTGTDSRCLTFWYHMYGKDIGTLNVYMYLGGQKLTVFSKTGPVSTTWNSAEIWLPAGEYQLVFEGIVGGVPQGDIAIDDVKVTKGECPSMLCTTTTAPVTTPASTTAHNLDTSGKFICNFGTTTNAAECIADDYTADFNWQTYAGATGSSSTGPTNDHTTGTSTGYYKYTEASSPRTIGQKARMVTKAFDSTKQKCLTFWYHMFGGSMGTLNIYIVKDGTDTKVWSKTGDNGNNWSKEMVNLPPGTYQIAFEGIRGSDYMSDMALDDIEFAADECPNTPTEYCFFNPCKNGGSCVNGPTSLTCKCAPGFHGKLCEKTDYCYGTPCKNGATCMSLDTTYSCMCDCGFYGTTCDTCGCIPAAGCWKTIQERIDGSESFDRTMAEYASGFGTAGKNFWLGLDTISEKTLKCNHGLEIQLTLWDGKVKTVTYDSFKVTNAADKYKLTVTGFKAGTSGLEDALIPKHVGMPFSTKDQDNDKSTQHCAQFYKGGWWFNDCQLANLNGPYTTSGNKNCHLGPAQCITWIAPSLTYTEYTFKGARMRINRV